MPRLTVVIPAYNERFRLPATIARIIEYLEAKKRTFEVVDDGSSDGTAEIAAEALAPIGPRGRVLRHASNRGKGAAVRRGMLAARGDLVLFSDADLSTPIGELEKLETAVANGASVAFGSRAVERRLVERRQAVLRDWMGRVFNLIVRLVAVRGISGTQCGFKLFVRAAVDPIFSRQRLDRFGFDVEVLAIARHLGYRLTEVPVRWLNDFDSRVGLLQGANAFLDPFRVRLSFLLGRYSARSVAEVVEREEIVEREEVAERLEKREVG